jgi:nucleoid DNA-binding protein
MNEKYTTLELIARIVAENGVTKKLSSDLIRVLPEIIEAGLERDGEVKVPGLGTFRLKWVETRFARNLKTGEEVEVPAHSKVVFLPEKSLKEQVNGDFRFLTYQVLDRDSEPPVILSRHPAAKEPDEVKEPVEVVLDEVKEPAEAVEFVREVIHKSETDPEAENAYPEPGSVENSVPWFTEPPENPEEGTEEVPEVRKRKMMYWIIPLLFVIIALLVVVFYMKNFRNQLVYPEKEKNTGQQAVQPAKQVPEPVVQQDTLQTVLKDTAETAPPQEQPKAEPEPQKTEPVQSATTGFTGRQVPVTGGKYLFQLAREVYGNPYLWSLIYQENQEKIKDPQQVLTGLTLTIPSLEGTTDHLTRGDSSRVSEGYRLIYEYYNALGDERAKEYRWAVNKYSPK